MNSATLQSLLLLAALGLPLLAALALTIASWRGAVMRATPVAAMPALLLVFAGQNGASLHLPSLGQHAVLGLDAVGRIFLGFTSVLWLTSGCYARAYSSISQMGIITTGVGIGALRPEAWSEIQLAVLIYATHHALAKGALFLGVGPTHAAQTRLQIVTARVGLLLPALALAGAPFTSGALAKVALKSNVAFLPGGWADALSVLLPLAAVGTALKMARFLWLTWPRHPHSAQEQAKGLWPPWLCMVGAVLLGVWLLPGALGLLPAKLTPQKLWLATWPLLGGAGLAMLGAWLRRWFSGDLTRWLPAGDLGVLLEKLVTRVELRLPARPAPDHGDGHDAASPAESLRWSARLAAVGGRLMQIEKTLRAWPVADAALLLLIGLILWLLAVSTS